MRLLYAWSRRIAIWLVRLHGKGKHSNVVAGFRRFGEPPQAVLRSDRYPYL